MTDVIYDAEMRDHVPSDTITDNWRQDLGRELVAQWVGETTFMAAPTPASATSSASASRNAMPAMPGIPEEQPTVFDDLPSETEQERRMGDLPRQQPQGHVRQATEQEPDPGPPTPKAQAQMQPPTQLPVAPVIAQQPAAPSIAPQPVAPLIDQLHQAMRNPQRLDGHPGGNHGPPRSTPGSGYGPQGGGARVFTGPYLGEAVQGNDWPAGCEDLSDRLDLRRLADASEFSDDSSSDDSTCYKENPKLEAFLTGKAVRSEINLNDLSAEDRAKFDQPMEKEWNSFKKFSAVEILTESQIADLPQDAEIVNTRWVHTDKNQNPL